MNSVLVIGAARSGVAAANFLAKHAIDVVISDSKPESELELSDQLDSKVRKALGTHSTNLLDGVDTVVLSPGVPASIDLVREAASRSIPVISEVELAFRNLSGKVIAITGTNGKSTTTALIGEILRAAGRDPIVAGNIGDPLISVLDSKPGEYVIELSSFQLETVETFKADIALLLNITPDHLDRYSGIDAYAAAKERIFQNQGPNDVAVVNADDARTRSPQTKARVLRFSSTEALPEGGLIDGNDLVVRLDGKESRIRRDALRIPGMANVENALAAWLAARAAGVADEQVEQAFRSFKGLRHRMELIREINGVRYLNDSKGTNVDATLKSLEGMEDQKVLLILGGKDKAGEFARLAPLVAAKAKLVMTIGAAADTIASALAGIAEIVSCDVMSRAVALGHERATKGDTVLLSPACASFDQYRNFEERGSDFERLVKEIR
ncbi:MAG TPA: UDP-N-acetylmuramoyl-L-alanine--D-glutamate ligase [Thermoanaerobaculia bacterium]|nr:UDP-N-acetylmuramoyl-L-alanine--D-glutamate ligase [Thermoanaerobaculia bacterium]